MSGVVARATRTRLAPAEQRSAGATGAVAARARRSGLLDRAMEILAATPAGAGVPSPSLALEVLWRTRHHDDAAFGAFLTELARCGGVRLPVLPDPSAYPEV